MLMNNNMFQNYPPFPNINPYFNQNLEMEIKNIENKINNIEKEINRINNRLNQINNNYSDYYTNNYQSQRYNMM